MPSALLHRSVLSIALVAAACSEDTSSGPGSDHSAPVVTGIVYNWNGEDGGYAAAYSFEAADTIHFSATMHDNVGLRWLGLEIGSHSDSLELPDSLSTLPGSLEVAYPVPAGLRGNLSIHVFAVDLSGNRTAIELDHSPVWIYGRSTMTQRSGAFPGNAIRFAFDRGRNRIYFTDDSSTAIGVYDVGAMAPLASLATPDRVRDLDLSPDGSHLVVTLPRHNAIASLPLDSAGTIHESSATGLTPDSIEPRYLRIGSNGHALVSFADSVNAERQGELIDDNLTTQSGTFVANAGAPGLLLDQVYILASTDRKRIVAYSTRSGDAQLFSPEDGSIGPVVPTQALQPENVSADSTGNNFLLGPVWHDANLANKTTYSPPKFSGSEAISLDGTTGYFATYDGFIRIDLASGRVLDHVYIGFVPFGIIPEPGTKRLFLFQPMLSAVEVTLTAPPALVQAVAGLEDVGDLKALLGQAIARAEHSSLRPGRAVR